MVVSRITRRNTSAYYAGEYRLEQGDTVALHIWAKDHFKWQEYTVREHCGVQYFEGLTINPIGLYVRMDEVAKIAE